MIQKEFAQHASRVVEGDPDIIGLAVGGSWLSDDVDEYSDLDLIMVTREKITDSVEQMVFFAHKLGNLVSGFTGEHVGEPRLLICLYDQPLLHVDIKFLTLEEFDKHIERPHILADMNNLLHDALDKAITKFPYPNFQWIEDRIWTWVHYGGTKIGRGEYIEALDFFGFLRMTVFGPLLHIKNGGLPRGVRKVEKVLSEHDLTRLKATIGLYDRESLLLALKASVELYRDLRNTLYGDDVILDKATEWAVMKYLERFNEQ